MIMTCFSYGLFRKNQWSSGFLFDNVFSTVFEKIFSKISTVFASNFSANPRQKPFKNILDALLDARMYGFIIAEKIFTEPINGYRYLKNVKFHNQKYFELKKRHISRCLCQQNLLISL